MSDYTQITDFSAKDALTTGDAEKIILGADIDAELSAISTAVATKYDSNDVASEAQAEALSLDNVLITPLQLANVLQDNAGMAYDIQQLADPGADTVLGWDDSASAAIGYTAGAGIVFSGTTLTVNHDAATNFAADEHVAHSGVTLTAGNGLTGGGTIAASRSFAVGAGSGITVNADNVAITDVAAGAGQPVAINSGTVSFDMSSLATLDIESLSQTQDAILVSDNGVLKLLPVDRTGSKIASSSTKTINGDDDVNVIYVNTTASDHTMTVAPESTYDFPVGTEVGFLTQSTGNIILAAGAGVTINSLGSNLQVKASGGGAFLIKTGTNIWSLVGNLE